MSVMTEDRDVEMCKSFNLKKRALRAEYCIVGIPHNTAIWLDFSLRLLAKMSGRPSKLYFVHNRNQLITPMSILILHFKGFGESETSSKIAGTNIDRPT